MKTILIICALMHVHSTTNLVRELRAEPRGLVWRDRSSTTSSASYLIDSQNTMSELIMYSTGPINVFRIGFDSHYASLTNSMMILPPSELHPYFRMIENPVDPTTYGNYWDCRLAYGITGGILFRRSVDTEPQ
jgi:hypothetical protein